MACSAGPSRGRTIRVLSRRPTRRPAQVAAGFSSTAGLARRRSRRSRAVISAADVRPSFVFPLSAGWRPRPPGRSSDTFLGARRQRNRLPFFLWLMRFSRGLAQSGSRSEDRSPVLECSRVSALPARGGAARDLGAPTRGRPARSEASREPSGDGVFRFAEMVRLQRAWGARLRSKPGRLLARSSSAVKATAMLATRVAKPPVRSLVKEDRSDSAGDVRLSPTPARWPERRAEKLLERLRARTPSITDIRFLRAGVAYRGRAGLA